MLLAIVQGFRMQGAATKGVPKGRGCGLELSLARGQTTARPRATDKSLL
jgi:hypothetical protein